MNQLEHLRALRDKARVQTEQAKAVLAQQGEITESLDRLIEALEGDENTGSGLDVDSVSMAKGAAIGAVASNVLPENVEAATEETEAVGSLGELISNLDEKPSEEDGHDAAELATSAAGIAATGASALGLGKDESGAEGAHDDIVWVEEATPEIPTPDKTVTEKDPPKLEPIVWEVADASPVAGGDLSEESEAPKEDADGSLLGAAIAVGGIAAAAAAGIAGAVSGEDTDEVSDTKFKFRKFGTDEESATEVVEEATEEATAEEESITAPIPSLPPVSVPPIASPSLAIPPPPFKAVEEVAGPDDETIAIDPSLAGGSVVPVTINEPVESTSQDDETIAIDPGIAVAPGAGLVAAISDHEVSATATEDDAVEAAVSSNIFFDANSAYLKDSELTKIQTIAEAVAGAERRIVKIQGLEDLASSNDFKVLLASRRVLAVKKKLSEKGIEAEQIAINEIQLSEEGRVLDPPSIALIPA